MTETRDLLIVLLLMIAIIGIMVIALLWVDYQQCFYKTENIGFNHRWSVFGSCQIEVNEGQWIPLDAYYFKQE